MRQSAPGLGAQGYLERGKWQASVGYRWQYSDRHFTGDNEDEAREEKGNQVINDIHTFDLSLTYAVTERFNLTLGVPFQLADRSQAVTATNGVILERFHTRGDGLGDVRLLASMWLFEPATHKKGNIALGLGAKFPTGEKDAKDTFHVLDRVNGTITNVVRNVDQSIQPGDGGYGLILDLLAYKQISKRATLYAAGTYIISPEEKSGVLTGRGNNEGEMSIADAYLGRVGMGYALWPEKGLTFTLAARAEGVPVRDLIGGSTGFRRPGVAVSIEPGLVLATKHDYTFSLSAPVAVYRNRERSIPDLQTSATRHGDAAFADFIILFGVSKKF